MVISEQVFLAANMAFMLSLIATRVVQHYAVRKSLLDHPNERSSHVVPVPRLGGIAIAAAVIIAWMCSGAVDIWQQAVFVGCAVFLAFAGLLDDLRPLGAAAKYLPQIVSAAVVAVTVSPTLHVELPFREAYLHGWLANVLVVVWITAVTNAFNFMDGVDGLAGSVALLAAVGVSFLVQGPSGSILIPFAAAVAGFLIWNTHPASIFMGDVGSQFLGFVLAASILFADDEAVPTIPVIIVFVPFLFDTGYTLVRRAVNGDNIFTAHKTHLYQRLNALGIGHRNVTIVYTVATAFAVGVAVSYRSATDAGQLTLTLVGAVLLVGFPLAVSRVEKNKTALWDMGRGPTARRTATLQRRDSGASR